MLDVRPILFVLGALMATLAVFMIIPALADVAADNPDWSAFLAAAVITLFVGVTLVLTTRDFRTTLNIRQAFMLTTLVWIVLPAFAALPLLFANAELGYAGAYFEAMSGLTTTGATVLTNLNETPPGILLWRSILQWLGGIGVVVMAISVLPAMRVGGMELFRMEFAERVEKVLPRVTQIGVGISGIYVALTSLCAVFYWLGGMTAFEAVNHAMTTLATGGFSTRDASMGDFETPMIETTAIVFMIVGSLPFLLYLRAFNRDWRPLLTDSQVRWFFLFIGTATLIMTGYVLARSDVAPIDGLREAAFNVISIMTGTGYSIDDFQVWGPLMPPFFLLLMFVGGCAGSTSCGIKIFRFQVLFQAIRVKLNGLSRPHRVFLAYYNGRNIPDSVTESVVTYFFAFMTVYALLVLALALCGLDFITALSAAASMISCVGPGLGEVIGPTGNYAGLSVAVKWLLSAGMLLGRLEIFTVIVLLNRNFWKN